MFQIVCTLTLAIPAVAGGVTYLHGISPEPWGHADHTGITCRCCSSDRTGAYVHVVVTARGDPADPRPSVLCARTIPALNVLRLRCSPADVAPVTYPYLANPSPADFAPATLRRFSRPFCGMWVLPAVSQGIHPLPV